MTLEQRQREISDSTGGVGDYPWELNDVDHWLAVYLSGSAVRADRFIRNGQMRYPPRQLFHYSPQSVIEFRVQPSMSNSEIAVLVNDQLDGYLRSLPKGREMDRRCIQNLLPFIDWRGLFKFSA